MAAEGAGNPASTEELYKLMDKALCAGATGRNALAAAIYRRAAEAATIRVHGDTLIAAHLSLCQAAELLVQAAVHGVPADEATALRSGAWVIVSGALPLLLRRMEDDTLLPGRCTKEEAEYCRRFNNGFRRMHDWPALSPRCQAVMGSPSDIQLLSSPQVRCLSTCFIANCGFPTRNGARPKHLYRVLLTSSFPRHGPFAVLNLARSSVFSIS